MKARSAIKDRKAILAVLASGAVLICLIAFLLYTNRKTEIAISVTIEAPFGGVFTTETSCDPRPEYSFITRALKVTSSAGVDQLLPQITLRNTDTNQCTAEFLLELQPDQLYSVKLPGTELGDVADVNFSSGLASFRHEIRVTRALSGYLRLYELSNCSSAGKTYWCGGITLKENTDFCEGYSSFRDMAMGSSVRIYSSTNQLIASTNITRSNWDYLDPKEREILYCDLFWEVADVPYDEKGYSVEMTERRGKTFFTKDESADEMGIEIGLILK